LLGKDALLPIPPPRLVFFLGWDRFRHGCLTPPPNIFFLLPFFILHLRPGFYLWCWPLIFFPPRRPGSVRSLSGLWFEEKHPDSFQVVKNSWRGALSLISHPKNFFFHSRTRSWGRQKQMSPYLVCFLPFPFLPGFFRIECDFVVFSVSLCRRVF